MDKILIRRHANNRCTKIADIILSEAIDNNYGKQKDDMTVIVAKSGDFNRPLIVVLLLYSKI